MTDADPVGTVIGGKYRVRSKIGTGSMGDVFEAHDESTGQAVALKVLRVDDETLAARFLREAKTMSLFQHPNIVELLEVGKLDDGRLFFAAELVRGVTVRALLEDGTVETTRALAIVRQVLSALGHAHAMGVVHRDIKPENIMLADGGAPDGTSDLVKILDFGVAKLIGDTPAVLGEGTLTITGYGALGTPYYMSPEAVLGRVLDPRADIYSVGVLLFELLVGKPPYDHEDVSVLMRMHAAAPIPTVKDRAPDRPVTAELELVISESLAKKPELRFKSAAEMIDAIDAALRSLELLPKATKSTDVFGALPMKAPAPPRAPAPPEPSASAPAAFSPASIPSASQPVQQPPAQGPVVGHVVPANGPLFAPPMPQQQPAQPSRLVVLANRHRKLVLAGIGVFAVIIVVAIVAASSGGKQSATNATTASSPAARGELVKEAQDYLAAGLPAKAIEILEPEPLDDAAEAYVVLGHARVLSARRLDGLAAYERAIALDRKHAADPRIREHVERVLSTKDVAAAIVALELAVRLEPPAHDLVKQIAETSKLPDVRQRAYAIAERENFAAGMDMVGSWSLDLAQANNCEERLAAVRKLKRAADARALPALKRARSQRCVEREVAEAMAQIEQAQPAKPQ